MEEQEGAYVVACVSGSRSCSVVFLGMLLSLLFDVPSSPVLKGSNTHIRMT